MIYLETHKQLRLNLLISMAKNPQKIAFFILKSLNGTEKKETFPLKHNLKIFIHVIFRIISFNRHILHAKRNINRINALFGNESTQKCIHQSAFDGPNTRCALEIQTISTCILYGYTDASHVSLAHFICENR